MNPSPPAWIRAMIATCPNGLQWVAVSTTTSPVTHTADVAVNRAVIGSVQVPAVEAIGSIRIPVPIAIRTRNPSARTTSGRRGWRRIARPLPTRNDWGRIRSARTRRSPGSRPCRIAIAGV